MDTHVMARPQMGTPRHLRRTKLIGAFAFGLLVGVGSYTATYHVLDLMSQPPAVVGVATPGATATQGAVHPATPPAPPPTS